METMDVMGFFFAKGECRPHVVIMNGATREQAQKLADELVKQARPLMAKDVQIVPREAGERWAFGMGYCPEPIIVVEVK